MIPEGAENHIADSKADAENEDYKYQAKALSAIKKGLESSVFELLSKNEDLESTVKNLEREVALWERFCEWMMSEDNSYNKRYDSDDDNDGKWFDYFSEGINRHYYTTKQLFAKWKTENNL